MTRKPPRHTTGPVPEETPVVLPHAVITVTETGVLDVTVDGTDVPPPDGDAWTRSTFGPLMDALTRDRTSTVRIEVHESDGTVFTDVIRTRRRTAPKPPETEAETEAERGRQVKGSSKRRPEPVEVTGDGFVPGEDVAVAVIIAHADAISTGHARALLDRGQLRSLPSDVASEVVLFGRVSGTIHVRRLP
ncbi:hypothetical protein ACT3S2_13820 [Arthrobacter sp. AOP36-A1-22]|uniref:hypothetical protein n=1 Tax=Micrococcales TaxID=85006 RepID=UPI000C58B847|nr:hypothetical protein [Brevibacterium sp. 239c]MDN5893030.1 hypothetical protein [Nocardioides sp.]SMX69543.1 hypothetical protein BSP239C_00362 [Brevibacterium sp. 239c]